MSNVLKIGRKIRDAEVNKIPFMFIVGEKESQNNEVSVRKHGSGDLGSFELKPGIDLLREEIKKNLPEFDGA
jgi:threonyl-tRNA synthetase